MWTRRRFEAAAVVAIALSSIAHAHASPPVRVSSDPLAAFRERFKAGMDLYEAGAPSEAIAMWEPLYAELGPRTGYRLGYDLAIAYAALARPTDAAEHFQAFLDEVRARRDHGELLDARVAKEAIDAESRMIDFASSLGRVRVEDPPPNMRLQLDASDIRTGAFTAWVLPGIHTVTFSPGSPDARVQKADVKAGETEIVTSPEVPAIASARIEGGEPHAALPARSSASPEAPTTVRHPFSPFIVYTGLGLTAAVGLAAIPLFVHANALRDQYATEGERTGIIPTSDRNDFSGARTMAYAALGTAAGLGAITAGLALWYETGAAHSTAHVEPMLLVESRSQQVGLRGKF